MLIFVLFSFYQHLSGALNGFSRIYPTGTCLVHAFWCVFIVDVVTGSFYQHLSGALDDFSRIYFGACLFRAFWCVFTVDVVTGGYFSP